MIWSSSSGLIELEMTAEQAASVSHQGQCLKDVEELIEQPEIKKQLDAIPDELMAQELAGYGAWTDTELQDNDDNCSRLVWLAGCDLDEQGE